MNVSNETSVCKAEVVQATEKFAISAIGSVSWTLALVFRQQSPLRREP